jgi:hypothetical protein
MRNVFMTCSFLSNYWFAAARCAGQPRTTGYNAIRFRLPDAGAFGRSGLGSVVYDPAPRQDAARIGAPINGKPKAK